METKDQGKAEVEALDLKSLTDPWVKKNWESMEEIEPQEKAKGKGSGGTTNSCNQQVMAKGTEKLVRVKGQAHSSVVMEDQALVEQDHLLLLEKGELILVDQEVNQKMVAEREIDLELQGIVEVELGLKLDLDL